MVEVHETAVDVYNDNVDNEIDAQRKMSKEEELFLPTV